MDLNYSAEESAFRDEASDWLRSHLPADLQQKVLEYRHLTRDDLQRWHAILAKKGWVAPSWPREWGGTDWNVVQRHIFDEACGYAGAPPLGPFGLLMCAPVLFKFGTQAQKERFLRPIYDGDEFWCQGYSEPGAGSDLASLRTTAVRHGDRYVVNGQKIWTTAAHIADWIFCLVRTSPATERKQDGISFLLIDMRSAGITVRPLILMDGEHEVNEVFFEGVEVSMLKIKGTEIQQALTELMMEAAGPAAQPFAPVAGNDLFDRFTASLAPRYCNYRKTTIYAGSNEIQRNIIAKQVLGL